MADVKALLERLRPTQAQAIDVAVALVVTGLGLAGFATSFHGQSYLIAGLSGAVLGAAVSLISARLKVSWLGIVATALVVFVVPGASLATRGKALGGVLPTGGAFRGLVDGTVHGWARLLTILPPAGNADNVLAVPYVCGYLCALVGVGLALAFPKRPFYVLPGLALTGLSIALGTNSPASLVVQGFALGAVLLAWTGWHEQRVRIIVGASLVSRVGRAAILLVAATLIGGLAGPFLPYAKAHGRDTIRQHITPPFDISALASPLAAYRKFVVREKTDPQLTVTGLPAGQRLRVAVMDNYDGDVWGVAGASDGGSGTYERIGATIPGTSTDTTAVKVTVQAFTGQYVPVVGQVHAITFGGADSDNLAEGLRFGRTTGTALDSDTLAKGDSYTVDTHLVPTPDPKKISPMVAADGSIVQPAVPTLPETDKGELDKLVADAMATAPIAKAKTLQNFLLTGSFTHGGQGALQASPGHSLGRLLPMLAQAPATLKGDDEQYAALMALAARSEGLPARVVVGFISKGSGQQTYTGGDYKAWTEIAFAGLGWVSFDATPTNPPTADTQPNPKPQQIHPEVPPLVPPRAAAAAQVADSAAGAKGIKKPAIKKVRGTASTVFIHVGEAAGVLLILALPLLLIVLYKLLRRRRRRRAPDPTDRFVGGWQEVLDRARDCRVEVPPLATRREIAGALPANAQADVLADGADAATFGFAEPADADAASFWRGVSDAYAALGRALPWHRRLRAAISTASLRTGIS